jgi:hypothetical protein
VQLENIATPQEDQTPELRYASLHRAVERGMASEEVLRELVEICLQLGHVDEALRVHASMKPGATRELVTSRLVRRGLLHPDQHGGARPLFALSNSDAPEIREHVLDAVQYLCQGNMPAVALLTMLAFPIVVGLGGFLTAGGSVWLFAGLAAIPGLCVLGVVGAMGRRIFLDAVEGSQELPPIPTPAEMIAGAKRYLLDFGMVLGVLVGPSITALWFDMPLLSSLPGLALGMFVVPVALILRQIRGDITALSPVLLVRAITACRGYPRVAGWYWVAFAPAALAFWTSLGHAVWLQIAIVGPLAVLPTFLTARFLGTFTELHKERLQPLVTAIAKQPRPKAPARVRTAAPAAPRARFVDAGQPQGHRHTPLPPRHGKPKAAAPRTAARPAPATTRPPAARPAPAVGAPNLPPRPSSLARKASLSTPAPRPLGQVTPTAVTHTSPPQLPTQRSGPPPAQRMRTTSPARIEGRAPLGKAPAPAQPQPPRAPAAPAARPAARPKPAAPEPPEPPQFEGPDVSGIPGARVIPSDQRERFGAASRRP